MFPSVSHLGQLRLAYRQPPKFKQLLTHNRPHNTEMKKGTKNPHKPRYLLCSHNYTGRTIKGPDNVSHCIMGLFICLSSNVMNVIF